MMHTYGPCGGEWVLTVTRYRSLILARIKAHDGDQSALMRPIPTPRESPLFPPSLSSRIQTSHHDTSINGSRNNTRAIANAQTHRNP